jgi:septum formation protein
LLSGWRLVLASGSPSRRRILSDAGISAEAMASDVDEETDAPDTPAAVADLAERKARAVASMLPPPREGVLVLGCDSLLDVDGEAMGKQGDPEAAWALWRRLAGRTATLYTGHCLLGAASGRRVVEVAASAVRFDAPTDAELEAYLATGEPFVTAGGFTVEGRGAPFVESIDGHPSAVMGLSLPVLRRLLGAFGVAITDLWEP